MAQETNSLREQQTFSNAIKYVYRFIYKLFSNSKYKLPNDFKYWKKCLSIYVRTKFIRLRSCRDYFKRRSVFAYIDMELTKRIQFE